MLNGVAALADGTFSVDTALTTATSLLKWVMDTIADNSILAAAFVVSVLIPAGVMVFHRIKGTV